jgi:proteasome assembly chaperone (PAC2) family protein
MELVEPLPDLVDPVVVAAFAGWNDAADAATGAVDHLLEQWSAQQVGVLDPEDYYDFQVNRPHIAVDLEGVRTLTWPATTISVARIPLAARDVVLVRGIEPSMRWASFCDELLEAAIALGCDRVVTLGALLAATPHTRPVPVSGLSNDPAIAQRLGFEPSTYEGPTGIVGVLQDAAQRSGLTAVSLWAAVPYYVADPPCPKATLSLLGMLEELLDVPVPLGDLPDEAHAWQRGADELAADDDEVAEYVHQLEEARDTAELPEATGDAIAREFERYLRRRGGQGPTTGTEAGPR